MPTTVPNQRTICVHREKASADFLGIKNRNWMAASRDLGAHALRLYLYLAANANNYSLALSPAALLEEIGMPRSTYHDQFKVLESKGYLIHRSGNTYDFYEKPQTSHDIQEKSELSSGSQEKPPNVDFTPTQDTEINIININFSNCRMNVWKYIIINIKNNNEGVLENARPVFKF